SGNSKAYEIYKKYGYTVREFAGMRTEQIVQILQSKGIDIEFSGIYNNSVYQQLDEQISEYNSKNSELTQFKRKIFQVQLVEYDETTARIKSMIFYEQGYTN